jgi:hypothetical protein
MFFFSVFSQTWFMEERNNMCGYVDLLGVYFFEYFTP